MSFRERLLLFVVIVLVLVLFGFALASCRSSIAAPKVDQTKIITPEPSENMSAVFKVGEETLDQIVKKVKFVVVSAPNGRHICVMVVGVADGYKWCQNIREGLCQWRNRDSAIGAKTVNMTYVPYEYCEPPVPK